MQREADKLAGGWRRGGYDIVSAWDGGDQWEPGCMRGGRMPAGSSTEGADEQNEDGDEAVSGRRAEDRPAVQQKH